LYTKSPIMKSLIERQYKRQWIDVRLYDLNDIKKHWWDFCIFRIDDLTVDEFLDLNEYLEDKDINVYFNCYNPLLDFETDEDTWQNT